MTSWSYSALVETCQTQTTCSWVWHSSFCATEHTPQLTMLQVTSSIAVSTHSNLFSSSCVSKSDIQTA